MTRRLLVCLALLAATLPLPARAEATCSDEAPVQAWRTATTVGLSNGCVTRTWANDGGIRTVSIVDERTGFATAGAPDFSIDLDGVRYQSDTLPVFTTVATGGDVGVIRWTIGVQGPVQIERTVRLYPGIAGFQSETVINSPVPAAISGYTLDRVNVGTATPTVHEFRAGADWREPDWNPPSIGPNHAGDWREAHTAPMGGALAATGEWTSAGLPSGEQIAIVNERRDYASSVGSYDGAVLSAGVDLSRDVVYIGPFEESGHVENPGPGPARHRLVEPGKPLHLETAFTVVARDADDEGWQWHKYLTRHRMEPWRKRVMFNSDKVDRDVISTGAKDDMNYARFMQILPAVREMGADTFVFDDGWMARSGDWCPDSAACPEPRDFGPRFPDDTFSAVRAALKGDPDDASDDIDLGLWMNPMSYHPSSKAFQTNPQWSCHPVGTGTGVVTAAQPDDGSNEAGIGLWNPRAMGVHPDDPTRPIRMIDYLQERIMRAIDVYGATIFKLDFLVWVDCAGAEPVTMYEYRDEFVAMLDRIKDVRPHVTFQIDDTNDHRMFPFETAVRGPSWFLNGGPDITHTLHTTWTLAPYLPGSMLGMRSLSSNDRNDIDGSMAAAITTHLTFSFPVDEELSAAQRAQVKRWTDFYHANADLLAGFTYPLLADPNADAWTALQPWDRDEQTGWLLAYRQQDARSSVEIPLRGMDGTAYNVTRVDPATGATTDLGTVSGDALRAGLGVVADRVNGYAFYRIEQI